MEKWKRLFVFATILCLTGHFPLGGVEKGEEMTPRTREAIERGLEYLAFQQNEDGSWNTKVGKKQGEQYDTEGNFEVSPNVATTSLACLAFMGRGSQPGVGPYGDQVKKGLAWILSVVQENGFISHADTRMYEHGFATLFLAEVVGMTGRSNVTEKLRKAVHLIVRSQSPDGGWRYLPGDRDADTSVTVCQVQALRAARNAGISIPSDTIEKAIRYLKGMQTPSGGFRYTMKSQGGDRMTLSLTAAGTVALYGLGMYSKEIHEKSLVLMHQLADRELASRSGLQKFDYFYGHYYAVQAMYQAGGVHWEKWWPRIQKELVSIQERDGSWNDVIHPCYATAMACLILQVPYRYLPIFQR